MLAKRYHITREPYGKPLLEFDTLNEAREHLETCNQSKVFCLWEQLNDEVWAHTLIAFCYGGVLFFAESPD